jgi:hypothetical protein
MALRCFGRTIEPTNPQEAAFIGYLTTDAGQQRTVFRRNEILMKVAQQRATDMATRDYFSHTDPDGYGANHHVEAAGYDLPGTYGQGDADNNIESIGAGTSLPNTMWANFMASEPHKDHLLGETEFFADQDEYGVGYAVNLSSTYDYYWCVLTARKASPVMSTRYTFLPGDAELPASNAPQLTEVNGRPVLAFDASTDESCHWTFVAPADWSGTPTIWIYFIMASATSGDIYFQAALESFVSGGSFDLDAGTSFDSNNLHGETAMATAGYMRAISITLTNNDSIAGNHLCRLRINRDADNVNDNASGDCYVLAVALLDAA